MKSCLLLQELGKHVNEGRGLDNFYRKLDVDIEPVFISTYICRAGKNELADQGR